MMNGIQNFLKFINDNWTTIVVIISLIVAIAKKAYSFFSKSKAEKIAIAKAQVKEIILKLISDAEEDYEDWNKAGSIKRSQVVQQIYELYPILEKVTDQEALISWIDTLINTSLQKLTEIITLNKTETIEEQ